MMGREETERLAAVERYAILDTPPDGVFDRVTRLAALIFHVPISTVSIVDHDRIWFKSRHGLDVQEIDRDPGLCASAILQDGPWIVADAALDPRTLENPLVRGEFGLRFYAAVPLKTRDGHNLGTLNVIGREPRQVTAEELSALEDLGGIVVDQLELRLAARNEGDRLTRAQADFITTAAHELRTPLAAVYGAAKLLELTDVRDDATREKLLAVIAEESDQLAAVVGDILSSAQLEAGAGLHTAREPCAPATIAGRAVDAARSHLPVNVSLELAAADVPAVDSDAARIKQILASLIDNAVKYSPDGGRIEVTVESHDAGVRFRVRDHGIGVPAADAERIFERFERLDAQQTRGIGGTGLGLYIARALAHELGGTLEFAPAADGGSTFTFDLPLHAPPSATAVKATAVSANAS